MSQLQIAIVGGGAAGFFAAIAAAHANPDNQISIFERGSEFLTKVRISGGGRCNVTHACFDPLLLSEYYPRGQRPLVPTFHRFAPADTMAWFEARGVRLKTEPDGRIFPVTDSSRTIVDCLLREANEAAVRLCPRQGVEGVTKTADQKFALRVNSGETVTCDRLLLATGGSRSVSGARIAQTLGHTIIPAVPSLFSLHIACPWLNALPGVSVSNVELSVPGTKLREQGPLLVTHNGLSGPVVLRLSAWGARLLHELNYDFCLNVNWLPDLTGETIRAQFQSLRESHPNKHVINTPFLSLPARLWEQLALTSGVDHETRWTTFSRSNGQKLARTLTCTEFQVNGKSLNKDEFVTCGGVNLREINFKTMESRITPHLYFAGELLDLDGLTGGFNFQGAWTTGWIAGHAMADREAPLLS